MTQYTNDKKSYVFEACDMRRMESIRSRLFDDKPLSGDQRRDLANMLYALMCRAEEFNA